MTVRQRLERIAKLANLPNLAELARKAGVGEGAMRQHVARDSVNQENAEKYAAVVRDPSITPFWVRKGNEKHTILTGRYAETNTTNRDSLPHSVSGEGTDLQPARWTGRRDLPGYGSVEGPGGVMALSAEPEYWTGRPEWAYHRDDFSIVAKTDIMAKAVRRGDRILVSNISAPGPGDLVLLIQGERKVSWQVAIRELVEVLEGTWRCLQLNPEKTENFPKAIWHTCMKIEGVRKK